MDPNKSEKICHMLKHQTSDEDTMREHKIAKRSCCFGSTDFIKKNIKGVSKIKKIEYDIDETDTSSIISSIESGRSSRSSGISSPQKISKRMRKSFDVHETLYKANMERSYRANQRRIESPKIGAIAESPEDLQSPKKSYIKQTTCQACKEKWRTPLPTPKTPKIKKASVIPMENTLCRTDSRNRISMLIHKELYTLESYNKRYSSSNSSPRSSTQKDEDLSDPTDYVKLDLLEFAKNKLEERQKETQKKVDDFLNGASS